MNLLTITGNIGADATAMTFPYGTVTAFNVAVSESHKKEDGTYEKKTVWYSCNYNNTNITQWLKKGTSVLVQGRPYAIVGKDGNAYINIRVTALEIMGHPQTQNQPQ